jgi:hypothetical protein
MMKRWMSMLALLAAGSAQAQGEYPFCQILDRVEEPAWDVRGSYTLNADVKPSGESLGYLGLRGGGGFGYYRTAVGDLDLTGAYDVMLFTDDGGLELPNALGALNLKAAFTFRNADGQALRLSAAPGLYTDLGEITLQSLYMPLAVEGIQSFTPEVSGLVGMGFYPGFDTLLEPRVGIRWSVMDALLIDLMYPESRIAVIPQEGWELYASLRSSQVQEWDLDDGRGSVMMDEMRASFGVSHPLTGQLRMMYQAGLLFDREIDFDRGTPEADIADAMFISVGVGGAL